MYWGDRVAEIVRDASPPPRAQRVSELGIKPMPSWHRQVFCPCQAKVLCRSACSACFAAVLGTTESPLFIGFDVHPAPKYFQISFLCRKVFCRTPGCSNVVLCTLRAQARTRLDARNALCGMRLYNDDFRVLKCFAKLGPKRLGSAGAVQTDPVFPSSLDWEKTGACWHGQLH